MNNQLGLVAKVFLLSALISTLIKYFAPSLAISGADAILPLNAIALIIVLLPTVIVAALLVRRIALGKRT